MRTVRAVIRGILTILYISYHITPGIAGSLFKLDFLGISLRFRKKLANRMLHMLGVRVHRAGEVPTGGPYIFIGNHRSYLDPVAVLREIVALPVAKSEVASWPLIGYGAKVTGVLFVQRDNKKSRADTLGGMEEYLQKGYSVLVYPEGTTHTAAKCLPLRRGTFSLAAQTGFPVLPIAIEYLDLNDAWVGNDTFIPHFMRCFGKKRTHILLRYGPPISGTDPAALIQQCQDWIDQEVAHFRQENDILEAI